MSIKSKVVKGLRKPHLIPPEIHKNILRINKSYYKNRYSESFYPHGFSILDEDWDNLLILDACRYDIFSEVIELNGDLALRKSRGSKTPQFARGNFKNEKLYDTVYVSANGYIHRKRKKYNYEFHDFIYVDEREAFDGNYKTAETTNKYVLKANKRYPNKKLIAHYIQPHDPFFTEEGGELFKLPTGNPLRLRQHGYDKSQIAEAYKRNLIYVLSNIKELLEHLEGKTVITSDHGELLGERLSPIPIRGYEHPEYIYVDELINVPWFVCDYESRKEVITEQPRTDSKTVCDSRIKEDLEALGYLL